jgi:hypothetical protein
LILPQLATLFAFFSFPEPGAASSKVTRMVLPVLVVFRLEKQREQYAHAVEALSDPERTRLCWSRDCKNQHCRKSLVLMTNYQLLALKISI